MFKSVFRLFGLGAAVVVLALAAEGNGQIAGQGIDHAFVLFRVLDANGTPQKEARILFLGFTFLDGDECRWEDDFPCVKEGRSYQQEDLPWYTALTDKNGLAGFVVEFQDVELLTHVRALVNVAEGPAEVEKCRKEFSVGEGGVSEIIPVTVQGGEYGYISVVGTVMLQPSLGGFLSLAGVPDDLWDAAIQVLKNLLEHMAELEIDIPPFSDIFMTNTASALITCSSDPLEVKVPDDYDTIQGAIDAVSSGGRVLVSSGTYNEALLIKKTVSLIGAGRDQTIIDGSNLASSAGIEVRGGSQVIVRVEGLSVRNFQYGSGIVSGDSARIIVNNSESYNNDDSGLVVGGGPAIITNNYIHHNKNVGLLARTGLNNIIVCQGNTVNNNKYADYYPPELAQKCK